MKELVVYEFEGATFTPVPGLNNKAWFVASEICGILSIRNVSQALNQADLDEDEKGIFLKDTPGGVQKVLTISESGLYGLLILSRKPIARKFKKWLRKEVLPAIREHGFYVDERQADKVPPRILAEWRKVIGREPEGGLIHNDDGSIVIERQGRPILDRPRKSVH